MKRITIFLAVLALMAALSPTGSEARYWGACRGALFSAWGACRGDPSGAECCSAAADAGEQCPRFLSWGWLGRVNARCEADNTPAAPTPPSPPNSSHPRLSCDRGEVQEACYMEIVLFIGRGKAIGSGCCKSLVHLIDECHTGYDFYKEAPNFWKKPHDYCVAHS